VVVFAEFLGDAQRSFAVSLQELEEVIASDEVGLRRLQNFRRSLVRLARDGGRKSKNFSSFGDAQDQALAVGGRSRKLDAAVAKDEYAARLLPFHKKGGAFGISGRCGNGFQVNAAGGRSQNRRSSR